MKVLLVLLAHLLTALARLFGPRGPKIVLAENLLLKHQLLILTRSRKRAPNLTPLNRILCAFWSLFLPQRRILRAAVLLKPSTLLRLHRALKTSKYLQWVANLRILQVQPVQSVPHVPVSHPFVERLIGTIRREYLDHILFWNVNDLEKKLEAFTHYYNAHRAHQGLNGKTPSEMSEGRAPPQASLHDYDWRSHCKGLFELPVAA